MPPNPKPSLKPSSPSDSNLRSQILTLTSTPNFFFSGDGADDDDDDFQSPLKPRRLAAASSSSSSSLRNTRSHPLKPPNNGKSRRPRKKPKHASSGKENHLVADTAELGSRVYSTIPEERSVAAVARAERCGLSESVSSKFEVRKGNYQSRLLESNAKLDLGGSDCEDFEVIEEKKGSEFQVREGNYHLNSIESRLLESNAKLDLGGDDCENFDVIEEKKGSEFQIRERNCHLNLIESDADLCEDFEMGTQLSELINLCAEAGAEGDDSNGNAVDFRTCESECRVECPLCGLDISDLSEEWRQLHTNGCLDKDGSVEVANSNHETKSSACGENVNNTSVVEWLRNLGLSRYEEIFVREEVDWETLQWLSEEDLLSIGITSLGPRKKIVHALSELRKRNDPSQDTESNKLNPASTEKAKLPMAGNKLITEYFQGSFVGKKMVCSLSKPSNLKSQNVSTSNKVANRIRVSKGKARDIPPWCCIPGTPFRVDAFRYLRGDCCHWFLTHFHIDHYQGVTRSFCHGKIYCSSITAHLVNHKIGLPWDRLHVLPLNQKITIAGVSLTCFDANHCPGSIIILFEPPNGKAVLHTGDFRFSSEMVNNPVLQSCHVHTLILDTTYCNPQYDFPTQETVIQFVIEAIQAEAFNPKTLFLIGSYTIGKERLFMEVARLLQKKVYVGAAKLQLLKFLDLPEDIMHWFTANEMESHIHVVPMWTLASFKRMKYFSNQYADRFDLIVAFSPTGWTYGKGRKKTPGRRWQKGTIIRYEVPYSEHCSFTELREFVRFMSPEHIIPSVNNDGPESADTMLARLLNDS